MPVNWGSFQFPEQQKSNIIPLPASSGGGGDGGIGEIFSGLSGLVGGLTGAVKGPTNTTSYTGTGQGTLNNIMNVPKQSGLRGFIEKNTTLGGYKHGGSTTPTSIIFHDTAGPTFQSASETLKQRGLSYNYIIDTDGTVHNLVPAGMKAFHAKGYNEGTVGISFVGGGGFGNVTPTQQAAAVQLTNQLKQQFPSITSFAGHRDRSHAGKSDPEGFDYTGFEKASGLKFSPGPGSDRYKYAQNVDKSPGFNTQVIPKNQGQHSELQATMAGIAGVETGGAKNPYTSMSIPSKSGDRAYGKYQIMGRNIPSWSKEAGYGAMTPQQFLANPKAQEAIAAYHINKNIQQGYSPEDVASIWFSGRPKEKAGNAKDAYGTSVPQYLNKFNKGYLKSKGGISLRSNPQGVGTPGPDSVPKIQGREMPYGQGLPPLRTATNAINNPGTGDMFVKDINHPLRVTPPGSNTWDGNSSVYYPSNTEYAPLTPIKPPEEGAPLNSVQPWMNQGTNPMIARNQGINWALLQEFFNQQRQA